jgi:hypothetical protein
MGHTHIRLAAASEDGARRQRSKSLPRDYCICAWMERDRPLVNWCVTETSSFISPEISAATVFRKSPLDSVAFAALFVQARGHDFGL